jgi:hypothetical protein
MSNASRPGARLTTGFVHALLDATRLAIGVGAFFARSSPGEVADAMDAMGVDHALGESRRTSIHADRVLLADHERDAARSASRQTRSASSARSAKVVYGVATNSVNDEDDGRQLSLDVVDIDGRGWRATRGASPRALRAATETAMGVGVGR